MYGSTQELKMPTTPAEDVAAASAAAAAGAEGGGGTLEDRRSALPEPPKNMKLHVDYFFSSEEEQGRQNNELSKSIKELNKSIKSIEAFMRSFSEKEERKREDFHMSMDEKIGAIRNDVDQHRREQRIDMASMTRQIQNLATTEAVAKMVKERDLNESSMMNTVGDADDSLDFSFSQRSSATALLDKVNWEERSTERNAPASLKYSLLKFKMPYGNNNWINAREKNMTETENAILDKLEIIPSREDYLKALRAGRTNVLTPEEEALFRKEVFSKGQKWDSDFVRDTCDWTPGEDFESWFQEFWRAAERNKIEDIKLFKQILYKRIYASRGKDLGEMIWPERNRVSSALLYYLQIRRLLIPVSDPETAAALFYSLKQKDKQTTDNFFQQKLRMFKNMHPAGIITKRQWRDFYLSIAKTLIYKDLAVDMARYVDIMVDLSDYSAFLNYMLKRCQYYVNWSSSDHFSAEDVTSCYSDAMMELRNDKSAETRTKTVINAVQSDVQEEVPPEESPDDLDLAERIIGAINPKNQKCWHCNRAGHFMNDCWSKQKGEPPAADARFGKTKRSGGNAQFNKFAANRFTKDGASKTPNNRVLPEQFAKAGINQVDSSKDVPEAGVDQDVEDGKKTMETLLRELYLKNAPID